MVMKLYVTRSKVAIMYEIPCSIIWCDKVHSHVHVKHNPIASGDNIFIAADECLDLGECLLNWVQIGGVRQ